jgi:hypothetical protein
VLGRLGEVEGRFPVDLDAHLLRVGLVVAADAEDPPDGQSLRSAAHGDCGHRRDGKQHCAHGNLSLGKLRGVPANLAEMLFDVVDQQLIDHEGRRLHAPLGILAGGFDCQVGITQTAQRLGGVTDASPDVRRHVLERQSGRVRHRGNAGGVGVIAAPGFPRPPRDPYRLLAPERHELANVAEVVHDRPDSFSGDPGDQLGRELLDLSEDLVGRLLEQHGGGRAAGVGVRHVHAPGERAAGLRGCDIEASEEWTV